MLEQKQRGMLKGTVISNKRQKEGTITVLVENRKADPKYHKIKTMKKKYLVNYLDRNIELPLGSLVSLRQIAPVSKKKTFQIDAVLNMKNKEVKK